MNSVAFRSFRLLAITTATGLVACSLTLGCNKKSDDTTATVIETEVSQQLGDVMASIDESSGTSNGTISQLEVKSSERMFARLSPSLGSQKFSQVSDRFSGRFSGRFSDPFSGRFSDLQSALIPRAEAASCLLSPGFGSCGATVANTIIRDFNSCTIGTTTFQGTVTLTWGGGATNCQMTGSGQTITRAPDFTVTGRNGGTLTVSKTGTVGQQLTRTGAGVFTWTNDGIRRVIAANGTTLFDFTTETTGTGLIMTGTSRTGRTLDKHTGSTLRVTNNVSGQVCSFTPSSVSWTSSCNCPTTGGWSATCTDGKTVLLSITGCGTATVSLDGAEEKAVVFDRCYGS